MKLVIFEILKMYLVKNFTKLPILLLGSILILASKSIAQTCCSGGVPTSANLGMPTSAVNTLQMSLTYDFNKLNTLKTGTKKEQNAESKRQTHTVMLQLGYAFTKRFSVDAFIPYVRQTRTSSNFVSTSNIGDVVVLLKYKILSLNHDATVLTGAFGVKTPTGRDDYTSSVSGLEDITLSADLQPGSGAWDLIFWEQFTHVIGFHPSMSFISQATYTHRGINDSFDNGQRTYKFGREFQVMAGLSERVNVGKLLFDGALTVRYRKAYADRFKINQSQVKKFNELPNTGGQWIFINPSLTYWILPDLSYNFNITLPIFADITGTQVTPTYRLNMGFFYRLPFKKQKHSSPDNIINNSMQ